MSSRLDAGLLPVGHCEDLDCSALALERYGAQGIGANAMFQRSLRAIVDQDSASRLLGVLLQPRRQVDRFTDAGVSSALLGTGSIGSINGVLNL